MRIVSITTTPQSDRTIFRIKVAYPVKENPLEITNVATEPVDWTPLAASAYHAYGSVTDHKNYQGLPMPEWNALPPKIQEAWVAAVTHVATEVLTK